MPRANNKVADGLADLTMDHATSWKKEYETSAGLDASNLIIQTDGGRRTATCAAASLVVGLVSHVRGRCCHEPLYAQGIYLAGDVTMFQTEAIALEVAVQWAIRAVEE